MNDDISDPGVILYEHLANFQLSGVGGSDLHRSLTLQSDALTTDDTTEIIDFLLQWEEGDDGVRAHSLSASVDAKQRLQETYEVLDALNHVDKELEDVDGWLAEQVQCLSMIQSRLQVIEKESGTLEKGYQNLKAIQDLSASLVQGLSLSADDERVLLMRPESVLEAAYKLPTLAPDAADVVAPLVTALRNIKKALALKGGNQGGGGGWGDMGNILPRHWAQVQSLTAVSKQRQKLVELSTFFCGKFVGPLSGLFTAVLQHRSLHDPPHGVKRGQALRPSGVIIKRFSFEGTIDSGLKFGTHLTDPTDRALFATRQKTADSHAARGGDRVPLSMRPSKDINEDNVALFAQRAYHAALEPFVALLALVLDLSPSTIVPLSTAYVTSAADKLYAPLFRVMFQDLRSLVAPKGTAVTMASIQRFRHSTGMDFEVPLKFVPPAWLGGGGGGGGASRGESSTALNTWTAFGAALLALAPIVKREQAFFLSLFSGLDTSGLAAARPYEELSAAPKCAAEGLMDVLFSSLVSKLHKFCGSAPGGAIATAAIAVPSIAAAGAGPNSTGGGHEGVDGMETIAVLVVLQQFLADHLGVSFPAAAADAVLSLSLSLPPSNGLSAAPAVAAAVAPPKPLMEDYSTYFVSVLLALRRDLLLHVKAYTAEQATWIQLQKSDPKKAGVSLPVAKFPSFVRQVLEMTGGLIVDFAEELLYNLAKQLLQWIEGVAALNDKYADVVRVQNFGFFALAVGPIGVPALEKFVNFAAQQRKEAETRYVLWMVSYSFPQLSALMARMDSVGTRVREEELALYVRRKDVVSVVGELDGKQLMDAVGKMYKRLEKHCASADDHDLDLVAALWKKIRDRVVSRLQSLEEAALVSYQLVVPVTSKAVKEIFNRWKRR